MRGLFPSDQVDLMRAHLEHCRRCRDLHDVWHRVLDTVIRESRYVPDAADVHAATAAFAAHRTPSPSRSATVAKMVFDSFRDPAPVGVRSAVAQARHLIFEAENWTIAIRLNSAPGNRVVLAGQVTQSGGSLGSGQNLEVTISDPRTVIVQTKTNLVGEFYLQYGERKRLRLDLQLSAAHALQVELPSPDD